MSNLQTISDAAFSTLINGDKPVIVDFWAEWCAPCRAITPIVEKLSAEYPEVTAGKMNVEENTDTPAQFGVRNIPTIILFNKGEEVDRVVGASPPMLKELFEKGKAI